MYFYTYLDIVSTVHLKLSITYLNISNLQHSLAEILALKHPNKSLWPIVNTIYDALLGLETSIMKPLSNILVAFFDVNRSHCTELALLWGFSSILQWTTYC